MIDDQLRNATVVRYCPQAKNRSTRPLEVSLNTETTHTGCFPLTGCISCSKQNVRVSFIFRVLFQHLGNTEIEKKTGYICCSSK